MKGEKNKIIYSLFHNIASELWNVLWAGSEGGWESKKVAGRAGREEREAHIFLPCGLMLSEKGGNTFAQVVITAPWPFCNFPCWSCAAVVSMNTK